MNMMKTLIILVLVILLAPNVFSDGNISTSGDLYLDTVGGDVRIRNGSSVYVSNSENDKSLRMYQITTGSIITSDVTDLKFTSPQNVYFYPSAGYVKFYGDQNIITFYMIPKVEDAFSVIRHRPASNTSNEVRLYLGYDNSNRAGLSLFASQEHDKKLMPWTNNEYDFGSPTSAWNNCYCNNLYYNNDLSTFSKGYSQSGKDAFNSVTNIITDKSGEIIHQSVDKSLLGDENSLNVNSVIFANSKAINYTMNTLMNRINELEKRVGFYENNCIL